MNEKGNTLVELIMVMMLFTLFGVTIYTLVFTGSQTQSVILEEKDAQMNARVAMSYINVRIRQNDAHGKITVEEVTSTGEEAILIKDRDGEVAYDTWIYFSDDALKESIVDPGQQPMDKKGMYTEIATIESFETSLSEDGVISNEITYYYGDPQTMGNDTSSGGSEEISSLYSEIKLRSW